MPTVAPRWHLSTCDDTAAGALADALQLSPLVARLLCQRGLGDPELASRFLDPRLEHLHDPMRLADMRPAVDRILGAIARKERIAIHGDYDVDGITSTVILRPRRHQGGGFRLSNSMLNVDCPHPLADIGPIVVDADQFRRHRHRECS